MKWMAGGGAWSCVPSIPLCCCCLFFEVGRESGRPSTPARLLEPTSEYDWHSFRRKTSLPADHAAVSKVFNGSLYRGFRRTRTKSILTTLCEGEALSPIPSVAAAVTAAGRWYLQAPPFFARFPFSFFWVGVASRSVVFEIKPALAIFVLIGRKGPTPVLEISLDCSVLHGSHPSVMDPMGSHGKNSSDDVHECCRTQAEKGEARSRTVSFPYMFLLV